VIEKGQEYF